MENLRSVFNIYSLLYCLCSCSSFISLLEKFLRSKNDFHIDLGKMNISQHLSTFFFFFLSSCLIEEKSNFWDEIVTDIKNGFIIKIQTEEKQGLVKDGFQYLNLNKISWKSNGGILFLKGFKEICLLDIAELWTNLPYSTNYLI